jgi:demethylmenaquinone methyltransferase/2-methoxy-6-polyprenyl-1,4-benzoquinol methylase
MAMRDLPSVQDKPRFVAAMFGRIARRYDLMNTLMTFGQDSLWRREVARSVGSPSFVLDVGTGTAKLAHALARRHPTASVVGADFSLPMLSASSHKLPLVAADALKLPFKDESFDAVTSGFLLRNLADLPKGLKEQARVLRRGGRIVILETTPGPPNMLRPLFRLYFSRVVPLLGSLVAGDSTAYTYLPASSAAFVEPEDLAKTLRGQGFTHVRTKRMALGTVAVISGARSS